MNPFGYFIDYFETNHFTLYMAISLFVLTILKYLRLPRWPARTLLPYILLIGLVLRVFWIGFSSYEPQKDWNPKHMLESDATNVHAIELTKGIWFHDAEGKPAARRPIGYPMLLALFYKLFGVHSVVAFALNLVLFALAAWLIYLMTETIFSERVALLACLLFALYPISIYSVKLITDEHLFLPLWYGGLYLLMREMNGKKVHWALLWYGLLFGYATMTRTHTIFMPVVVALAYFWIKFSWKKVALSFLAVFLIMQLINLPWVIRNYRIWGVPILYTADAGHFMYAALNSSTTPEGSMHIPERGEPDFSEELEKARLSGNVGIYNAQCYKEIQKWIIRHPKEFLALGMSRLLFFMRWDREGGVWPIWFQYYPGSFDPSRPISDGTKDFLQEMAFSFYYSLFFCFVFSCCMLAVRWKNLRRSSQISLLVFSSCFFFWFIEHMIIFPDRKYRFPLEPLMIVGASFFLDYLIFSFRYENLKFLKKIKTRKNA